MSWRFALENYIQSPENLKEGVIYYDEKAVIINDMFPKSTFHLLVLTRDLKVSKKHPATGLTFDTKDTLQPYIERAQDYIYEEFTKKYKLLNLPIFFDKNDDFEDKEAFIEKYIQVGVHSVPSMANLHVHVMTRDLNSCKLKNKKHYNSFTTNFWIEWDKLPLDEIPNSREAEQNYLKNHELISIYNGKSFGNKFSMLKQHLSREFENNFTSRE